MEEGTPWVAGAAVLSLALVMNLLTGNTLWRNYTLVGILAFLVFYVLERRGVWHIPPRTMLLLAVLGAMHFLGGSLAGVHGFHGALGVNGAYFVFPWWDNLAHLLGGAMAWLLGDAVLRGWLDEPRRRPATSFAALGLAALAGVTVELYEFAGFLAFGTVDQGFYVNNMLDLYNDLLGALAMLALAHLWPRWTGATADEPGEVASAEPPAQP